MVDKTTEGQAGIKNRYKLGFVRRYAAALVVLATFATTVSVGALYNYESSRYLEHHSAVLNAIAQQKTLSQKMSKDILLIEQELRAEQKFNKTLFYELLNNKKQFTRIFTALQDGGSFQIGETGQKFQIEHNRAFDEYLHEIESSWSPLNSQIDILERIFNQKVFTKEKADVEGFLVGRKSITFVISDANEVLPNDLVNNPHAGKLVTAPLDESMEQLKKEVIFEINETTRILKNNNLTLLMAIENFNKTINNIVISSQAKLRSIQVGLLSMSIIFFLVLVFYFFRKLINSDKVAYHEQKEKNAILENVREGLFLMDKDWMIQQKGSSSLSAILNREITPPQSFRSILQEMVDEKTMKNADNFVNILFTKNVKDSMIAQLNPLKMVEASQEVVVAGSKVRKKLFLCINFNKIQNSRGKTSKLLVTIVDSTEKRKLEDKLKEEQIRSTLHFDFIVKLLNSDNKQGIVQFLQKLQHAMEAQNTLLKEAKVDEEHLLGILNSFQHELHGFKAEAGALELAVFRNALHDFEDKVIELRQARPLKVDSFHAITFFHKDIMQRVAGILKTVHLQHADIIPQESPARHLEQLLASSVCTVAQQYGKKAHLICELEALELLHTQKKDKIKHLLLHMVNNSVIHGLEDAGRRLAANKHPVGIVAVHAMKKMDNEQPMLQITIKDDGTGIDVERIRTKAIDAGLVSNEEAKLLGSTQLVEFIFQDNFSTAPELTQQAGRGIGLAYVRNEIHNMQGTVHACFEPGQFTEFTLTLAL